MKWWGWGPENAQFTIRDKPRLWPYVKSILGIEGEPPHTPPVSIDDIDLPDQHRNEKFAKTISSALREDQITSDKKERLVHAYGKSFRDLWRIRRGIVQAAPDCIIYPESEEEVRLLIRAASEHEVIVIPFGGGSNIAGCLEANVNNGRMIVSLDMKRMNRVISVDQQSRTARIQAGVLGPDMEAQLHSMGATLGHFPDSFEHSTLGGWIATRSAGMQSDKYGKIEDMVISVRMVTPSGTIVTRTVPKSSNGIDVKHLCIGSEGTFGVITEATMQVHRCPRVKEFYGYLFPDFQSGVDAVQMCVQKECAPLVTRLNDSMKTALSFAYATKSPALKALLAKGMKAYLKHIKRLDFDNCCLMITAFEGDMAQFNDHRWKVDSIYKKFGACNLGTGPGRAFERGKYEFPHFRDVLMDRNIMADVSETATVWSNLMPLYHSTMDCIDTAIRKTGSNSFLGCHISHTYHTGASLYFTFGCAQKAGKELEQYLFIKKAAEDCFMKNGATLSHHHGVGSEHLPWVEADISTTGVKAVKALKDCLDPRGVMNPGKIIPSEDPLRAWGLDEQEIKGFEAAEAAKCSPERQSS